MENLDAFFAYAKERYNIFMKRETGEPWPWTEDPILQKFRFTNVFREDDRTTRWFRENVREPLRDDCRRVYEATIAFRWFNRIAPTGEVLLDLFLDGWDGDEALRRLRKIPPPHVTGAFIINSRAAPLGMKKFEGVIWCIGAVLEKEEAYQGVLEAQTLQAAHGALLRHGQGRGMGGFLAHEAVTDFRYTNLLEGAEDADTWCHLGPGAKRGLGYVVAGDREMFNKGSKAVQEEGLAHCLEILEASRWDHNWPSDWPEWTAHTVEWWCCEFSKIMTAKEGGKMKRRYHPPIQAAGKKGETE